MDIPSKLTSETLRKETAAVRALARELLSDEHEAEDVAQEAWLAALRQPPRKASLRPWLKKVGQNFARRMQRKRKNRRQWEEGAAKPEGLPSTAEVVERMALNRHLVDAVLLLEEPYRGVGGAPVAGVRASDLPDQGLALRSRRPVNRSYSAIRQLVIGQEAILEVEVCVAVCSAGAGSAVLEEESSVAAISNVVRKAESSNYFGRG